MDAPHGSATPAGQGKERDLALYEWWRKPHGEL